MLETQSADEVPLPEFAFSKHSAETIERLKTEIGGNVAASFCNRVCGKKRQAKEEELGALSLQELLQPKKKKRSAKAKAQPKAATSPDVPQESSDSIKADVQQTGGVARKRWWIDDLLACLIHAAGLLPSVFKFGFDLMEWMGRKFPSPICNTAIEKRIIL